jgi:GAF domain-containing protein
LAGKAEPYRTVLKPSLKAMTISKHDLYDQLAAQLSSLLAGERDLIANAANFSSLVFHSLPDLNWAGFYFEKDGELVLGPFQGQPACVRIKIGQGVCGAGAAKCATVIVPNVHEFPGHIACDSASNSEIVVPLLKASRLIGVLDLDSPVLSRFDQEDARGLESLVSVLLASVS